MKTDFCLKTIFKRAAALLLLAGTLSSCEVRVVVAEPSTTVGVGRAAELVMKDTGRVEVLPEGMLPVVEDQPPLDNAPVQEDNAENGVSWKFANGKYAYHFPEPDRSTLSDLSDVNNTPKNFFSDVAAADTTGSWYFGKTQYDQTTGEVTYVWDRTADTLALLDEYGGIYRGDTERKVCYLTFDCGYENGYTDIIMDVLKEKKASGTFFVTGAYVDSAQKQLTRMFQEGHIVGNHTDNHPNMALVSADTFIDEIESLEDKVRKVYPDAPPMLYYRPPEGATSAWALKMADKMGLRTVLWSYTYKDYDPDNQLDYATALQNLKNGLHPGCVYLLHAVSKTNSEVLGELIDWIRNQGYEILPLCDIDVVKDGEGS